MPTITVKLPGEAGETIDFEVAKSHIIHKNKRSFMRADAILDFGQALRVATSWALAQATSTGIPHRAEFTGDPEGDDGTITIAYVKDAAIEFARWSDDTGTPEGDDYGYGLDDFPFELEWALAPLTVEEFFEQHLYSHCTETAKGVYVQKLNTVTTLTGFYDDEEGFEAMEGYAEALTDMVLAMCAEDGVEVPQGLGAYITSKITTVIE